MICELTDTSKAAPLFEGWKETLIYSCLQKVMGADERRKGLATIACAALILRCLDEGLYPSWDAQNMNSVHLAEKLGYEFDHEYTAYEVS